VYPILGGNKKYAEIGDTIIAVVKAHQICLLNVQI
jgi:ribosomal protein L14